MADEVKTRLTVEGDEAIRTLEDAARAEQEHADALDKAGEAAAGAAEKTRDQGEATDEAKGKTGEASAELGHLTNALGINLASITGMVGGIVGVGGLIAAYQQWLENIEAVNQRLQENAQIVRDNAEARLNFVALQGVESAEDVERIDAFAAFAGRSPGEIARVQGSLRSQFPNASSQDISNLTLEVAAASQLTDASPTELAQGLSVIFREVGDARVAGNIFQEAIQQAGEAEPGRLAQEVGKFIGIGSQIGGLDAGEAAGFAAAGTGLGLPNEEATTGLKNVLFAIRGRGTPEGNEILDGLGIDRENVINALQQISAARQAGQIDDAQLEAIGGREAAPVFAALSDPIKLQNFLASVGAVDAAEDFEGRIVTDKAESIFTPGSIQSANLLIKQLEAQTESVRASDQRAARVAEARAALELRLAELEQNADDPIRGVTAADSKVILEEFDFQTANGASIEEALERAEQRDSSRVNVGRIPSFVPFVGDRNFVIGQPGTTETRSRENLITDPVLRSIEEGPQIDPEAVIDNQQSSGPIIINNGQLNINGGDPLSDDLDGRDRFA